MRQHLISAFATCATVVFAAATATAQDTVNVGFVLPMTGQLTSVGKQVSAGAQLYVQQHGTSVAGKKIELLSGTTVAFRMWPSVSRRSLWSTTRCRFLAAV